MPVRIQYNKDDKINEVNDKENLLDKSIIVQEETITIEDEAKDGAVIRQDEPISIKDIKGIPVKTYYGPYGEYPEDIKSIDELF